jgi:hypothetical protein
MELDVQERIKERENRRRFEENLLTVMQSCEENRKEGVDLKLAATRIC